MDAAHLTQREAAIVEWIRRWATALTVALAGAIGLLARASVQPLCFQVPYGQGGRPEPGSPRAPYCDAIAHGYRWVLFPVAAIIIAAALLALLRHVHTRHRWTLGALCVLGVLHFAVVVSLSDAVLVG